MAIHKLANGPLTMTVASITPMQGNFGPQFKLTGADGTDRKSTRLNSSHT